MQAHSSQIKQPLSVNNPILWTFNHSQPTSPNTRVNYRAKTERYKHLKLLYNHQNLQIIKTQQGLRRKGADGNLGAHTKPARGDGSKSGSATPVAGREEGTGATSARPEQQTHPSGERREGCPVRQQEGSSRAACNDTKTPLYIKARSPATGPRQPHHYEPRRRPRPDAGGGAAPRPLPASPVVAGPGRVPGGPRRKRPPTPRAPPQPRAAAATSASCPGAMAASAAVEWDIAGGGACAAGGGRWRWKALCG